MSTTDRKVTLDLETTGKYVEKGDRVISIGMVELINNVPTQNLFQRNIRPDGKFFMSQETVAVHGITAESLMQEPFFRDVAKDILAFIGDSPVVIHNMYFDLNFLKEEFNRAGYNTAVVLKNRVICTVEMSRSMLPINKVPLDKVAKYFGIDTSNRAQHGALKDALILAKVYSSLTGQKRKLNRSPINMNLVGSNSKGIEAIRILKINWNMFDARLNEIAAYRTYTMLRREI